MATRQTIKETFLAEVETAVSAHLASSKVVLESSESDVSLPKVAYSAFPYPVSYNDGSDSKPSEYVYNNSGEKIDEIYYDYRGERFDVRVEATAQTELEAIYEDVKSHFERYNQWLDSEDFHADCHVLDVDDTNAGTDGNTEPTSRHDRLTIRVEYKTKTGRYDSQGTTGDPIRTMDSMVDADMDSSTSGETYTTK